MDGMRKLILWDMLSLDGHFVDPDRTLDWFHFDDELERYIIDTQTSAGTLFFGRVTYEMMVGHWPNEEGDIADFMNTVPKVVFSRTLEAVDWANTRLVAENVPGEVTKLKEEPGGDIFTYGSADLSAALLEHGLVDEYRIAINPIILGEGEPFFKGGHDRIPLELVESRPLGSGLVILHYRPREA